MFEQFKNFSPFQASLLNSQELAFVGDAVFSVYVRSMLVNNGNQKTNVLHKTANTFVKASAQSEMLQTLEPLLTEEEQNVVRRAVNYKTNNKAKHSSLQDYKQATGFEALLGYLYISNQTDRLEQILKLVIKGN